MGSRGLVFWVFFGFWGLAFFFFGFWVLGVLGFSWVFLGFGGFGVLGVLGFWGVSVEGLWLGLFLGSTYYKGILRFLAACLGVEGFKSWGYHLAPEVEAVLREVRVYRSFGGLGVHGIRGVGFKVTGALGWRSDGFSATRPQTRNP